MMLVVLKEPRTALERSLRAKQSSQRRGKRRKNEQSRSPSSEVGVVAPWTKTQATVLATARSLISIHTLVQHTQRVPIVEFL